MYVILNSLFTLQHILYKYAERFACYNWGKIKIRKLDIVLKANTLQIQELPMTLIS